MRADDDLRAAGRARRQVGSGALAGLVMVALVSGLAGCESLAPVTETFDRARDYAVDRTRELADRLRQSDDSSDDGVPPTPTEAEEVALLNLGKWHLDYLHCAKGRCNNFYWINVRRSGELNVEVYVPTGPDLPDLGVALLDPDDGALLATPAKPDAQPKRLRSRVTAGGYVLRVQAPGKRDARLGYELIAKVKAPVGKTDSRRRRKEADELERRRKEADEFERRRKEEDERRRVEAEERAKASICPQEVLVDAEVLESEQEPGGTMFVFLDVGEPDVSIGMRGRLVEQGEPIGEVEVDEVYTEGSRARVVGELEGSISIDTRAELCGSD